MGWRDGDRLNNRGFFLFLLGFRFDAAEDESERAAAYDAEDGASGPADGRYC